MIMRAAEHAPGWHAVQALLTEMQRALLALDCERARKLLEQAVREYRLATAIHDLA